MITVNRYIVLAGEAFYPSGWDDYKGSRDTLEEALDLAKRCERWEPYNEEYMKHYPDGPSMELTNWTSVIDLSTMKEVDTE